jgi:hypothetical protein
VKLALFIALAGLTAVSFSGLSVLLISVVSWLWPSKDFTKVTQATSAMTGGTPTEFDVKELCQHLKTMPETELLRFGQVVKYMCSLEVNCDPPLERFLVQLREAKAEWRRRHPQLPLVDSI